MHLMWVCIYHDIYTSALDVGEIPVRERSSWNDQHCVNVPQIHTHMFALCTHTWQDENIMALMEYLWFINCSPRWCTTFSLTLPWKHTLPTLTRESVMTSVDHSDINITPIIAHLRAAYRDHSLRNSYTPPKANKRRTITVAVIYLSWDASVMFAPRCCEVTLGFWV